MAYERVNWENLPSKKTPVNVDNLNKMDEGIANIDTKINSKQDKLIAGTGIKITGTNIINNLNANYSTDEIRIGTWINGKPLYRKVIPFTKNSSANSTDITHNISNLGDVVNCYGYFKDGPVTRLIPQFYYADMVTYSISVYTIDAAKVSLLYGNWYRDVSTITNSYIILEYTKTTD